METSGGQQYLSAAMRTAGEVEVPGERGLERQRTQACRGDRNRGGIRLHLESKKTETCPPITFGRKKVTLVTSF